MVRTGAVRGDGHDHRQAVHLTGRDSPCRKGTPYTVVSPFFGLKWPDQGCPPSRTFIVCQGEALEHPIHRPNGPAGAAGFGYPSRLHRRARARRVRAGADRRHQPGEPGHAGDPAAGDGAGPARAGGGVLRRGAPQRARGGNPGEHGIHRRPYPRGRHRRMAAPGLAGALGLGRAWQGVRRARRPWRRRDPFERGGVGPKTQGRRGRGGGGRTVAGGVPARPRAGYLPRPWRQSPCWTRRGCLWRKKRRWW